MDEFAPKRRQMVADQIACRDVSDPRVLDAMRAVPRHRFVPSSLLSQAHGDFPLPVGEGQTISQPYIVALMTEHLRLSQGAHVLEIGCGSGYQTAVLSEVVGPRGDVVSIERIPALARSARERLAELGYDNITVVEGDGTLGHPEGAPYDGIIVTAAAPKAPEPLVEQLGEGGRLIIPVGGSWAQELVAIERQDGGVRKRHICGCRFVPLIGEHGWDK